jgi:hypothetical protein
MYQANNFSAPRFLIQRQRVSARVNLSLAFPSNLSLKDINQSEYEGMKFYVVEEKKSERSGKPRPKKF